MKSINFNDDWTIEEKEFDINIGDFVGVKGMDWDLEVYFPCIIYKYLNDDYVIVSECVNYNINDKLAYSKVKINELLIMNDETQLKWYKELKDRTNRKFNGLNNINKNSENWLDYIKRFKNYEKN